MKTLPTAFPKKFVEEKTGLGGFVGDEKKRLLGFQKPQSRERRNMYVYEFEVNLCRMWEKMNNFCYCALFYLGFTNMFYVI